MDKARQFYLQETNRQLEEAIQLFYADNEGGAGTPFTAPSESGS
jgi:hypothetical protein